MNKFSSGGAVAAVVEHKHTRELFLLLDLMEINKFAASHWREDVIEKAGIEEGIGGTEVQI